MVYLEPLHVAETTVATTLSRLMARLPPKELTARLNAAAEQQGATTGGGGGDAGSLEVSGVSGSNRTQQQQQQQQQQHGVGVEEEEDAALATLVWRAKNKLLQQGVALTDRQVCAITLHNI